MTLPGLGTFTDLWWTRAVNSTLCASQELRNGSQCKSDHLDPGFRCTKLLGHILLTFPNSLKVWQELRRSMVALACSVLAKKTSTMRSKKKVLLHGPRLCGLGPHAMRREQTMFNVGFCFPLVKATLILHCALAPQSSTINHSLINIQTPLTKSYK